MGVEDEQKLSHDIVHRILEPLKGSDPVYATSISKEMINRAFLDVAITVLASHSHSKVLLFPFFFIDSIIRNGF